MNADPIARAYRWMEFLAFGRALERCRLRYLDRLPVTQSALLVGDGDGRFLARLLPSAPQAAIQTIDSSAAMLALAQSRTAEPRVTYTHADILTCPLPDAAFDLISTHFLLDCFTAEDLSNVIGRLARAARPQATWIVSEFREPAWWARAIVRFLYLFFRLTTGLRVRRLTDHRPLLRAHGFELVAESHELHGLLAAEFWQRR